MKRLVGTLAVLLCFTMMMTGADISSIVSMKSKNAIERKSCVGYTIIEAGKGIDCYGDTISLQRVHGYYEVVAAK